jgi:hypothetical protein
VLRLIKRCSEFLEEDRYSEIPRKIRGIYVLYRYRPRLDRYDVVYVGMSASGIRGRIQNHRRSKLSEWTHFSVFEVWDNVSPDEIKELEGLFRHIYRFDTRANRLNRQRAFKQIRPVRSDIANW